MKSEALGQEIASLSAHLDAATHRLLECIRKFDEEGCWHDQGAVSCAHWLAWRVGLDPATAREKVRVARALGKLPAIDEALRSATLSYAKVRALTRVATPQTESRLLELALVATAAQLERLCRGYRAALDAAAAPLPEERSVHKRLLAGGMVKLELVLEPDEADLVLRAVERAREVPAAGVSEEAPQPTRADGAVALAESFLAGPSASGSDGARAQVMVHLEQEPLAADGEWSATLEDGTRLSAPSGALRRVACDCSLASAGRRSRSIPPPMRRALMARDRGCVFPGCTHTQYLHGHHIEHWLHGGETSLENLVVLCSFHHRLVHEGGWSVGRAADGALLFAPPGGKALVLAPPGEWDGGGSFDFAPEVNFPLWDGSRPDYKLAVGSLLEAN
jgi:hypothetical protein